MASMFKNKRTTLERVEKFISPLYFTDANLYGKLYNESIKLSGLYCCNLPEKEKMTFSQVLEQGEFVEVKIGESFGPTWATHWFRVDVEIPESWEGKEVHLRWNSNSEAMVWSDNGIPLQGLSGGLENQLRENFIITRCASVEEFHKVFYIEMACNTAFGAGSTGLISPPCPNQYFTLKLAEIAVFDRKVYGLLVDLEVLLGMVKYLPSESSQAYEALYAANEMVNTIVPGCRETYQKAEEIAHTFFSQRNGDRQHVIMAVGNCHIDCAWLWPFSETIRKCGRSWSSTVRLMEEYPNFYFACSQAQQFSWVKEYYPALYEQIRTYVSKGQFIPVGGSWVEMDGNIPSGEAFIRQFLYGQKFFQEEFGITCKELWLPDTFGFSAQLPQIMRHCGMTSFLTQKLSWNLVNRFPHNNFFWQGIDGSTVLTHLPPGDSYEMKVTVEDAIKTFQNLQDKGRVSCSLMLFGYGDGGGGPTLDMLERQKRLVNVDGVPRVQLSTPQNFFDCLENSSNNLCFWVGDLYLELHNATYTTQAVIKSMNRKCEFALRRTEILLSILMAEKKEPKTDYPSLKLENIWKTLLLTQFHDVLPGTSINKVNEEAFKMLNDVFDCAAELENVAALELFGSSVDGIEEELIIVNSLSWKRTELLEINWSLEEVSRRVWIEGVGKAMQDAGDEKTTLVPVVVNPFGYQVLRGISAVKVPVTADRRSDGSVCLKNQFLVAIVNHQGEVTSLQLLEKPRELISVGQVGNKLVMFDDIPLYWDAWDVMDYHLETKRSAINKVIHPLTIIRKGPLEVKLEMSAKVGDYSELKQTLTLDAVHPYLKFDIDISWFESHKFLKVEFPVNILANQATYEIQFGHLQRPTHFNTSWDWAKYEVCGHKWVTLSEYDCGVALLNTNKYGHAVHGSTMRISLLRSSKSPDSKADMRCHQFTYALMPYNGTFQSAGVIQQAYQLNSPIQVFHTSATSGLKIDMSVPNPVVLLDMHESMSWFQVEKEAVIIETLKKSENHENCLVIRLYESYGSHVTTSILSLLQIVKAILCDGLENPLPKNDIHWSDGKMTLSFKPFQLISVLLFLKSNI